MTKSVVSIEAAYADITASDRPGAAFARFENEVGGWQFDEHELLTHNKSQAGLNAICKARSLQAVIPGRPGSNYFAGSGIMVTSRNNRLIAADYHGGGHDPVADKYGPEYRKMGLIKVGRAALASRLVHDGSNRAFADGYQAVQKEVYGGADATPHTIGYSWRRSDTGVWAVGASGMIASRQVQAVTETLYDHVVPRDTASGLVSWEGDYFAGYHDQVAAEGTMAAFMGGPVADAIPDITALDQNRVNLH